MARNKSSRHKRETRTSFMFPSLHQDVTNAVSDDIAWTWFQENDSDNDSNNKHSTHVMGTFRCNNYNCPSGGWASKKVAMLIRGYPKNGYNAVVFNQRCKVCNQLGTLLLNKEAYIDRVGYRLKKWAGVPVEQPYYDQKESLPHETLLCEGCRRGFCRDTY
jgi:hypothetical protein